MRAVQMTTLNRQRANIVFSALLESDGALLSLDHGLGQDVPDGDGRRDILTPAQVAERELIFERDGVVKWHPSTSRPTPTTLGTAKIGVSIHEYLSTAAATTTTGSGPGSGSGSAGSPALPELITLFSDERYILSLPLLPGTNPGTGTGYRATILLKQACTSRDQLKAWMHALLAMRVLSLSSGPGPDSSAGYEENDSGKGKDENEMLQTLRQTLAILNDGRRFEGYMRALEENGWEVDCAVLETGGGRRISLH